MKKIIVFLAMVIIFGILGSACAQNGVAVVISDSNGKQIQNRLMALSFDSKQMQMVLQLGQPFPAQSTLNATINGVDITGSISSTTINLIIVSSAPVPAPIPTPAPALVKPTPPLPACWWGPKPTNKGELVSYLDGNGQPYQQWANWLKANPSDLDWAWSEYKKTN